MIKNKDRKLILVTDWGKHHSYPTIGQLRWLIFNAKLNGFNKVIRRLGGRILIDEAAFFNFIEEKNRCKWTVD